MANTINSNSFFNRSENNEASRAFSMAQESFNMSGVIQNQLNSVIKSVEVLKQDFVDNSTTVNNTFQTVDDTIKTAFSQLQTSFSKLSETVTLLSDDVNALSDVFFRMKKKDRDNLEAQADQAFEDEDKSQKSNKESGAGGGSGGDGSGGDGSGSAADSDDKDGDKKGKMNPWALGAMGLLGLGAGAIGGIKRGIGGGLDFLTGGLFDFDGRNAAQGGGLLRKGFTGAKQGIGDLAGDVKKRGIGGTLGGIADTMTMGLTDFDGKGKGGFNLFGKKKEEGKVSNLESRVSALESGNVKGDGKTVTRREVKPHHFDMETGKAYIDGEEVPLELYNEFKSMSPEDQLNDPRFSTGDPIISPKEGTDEKGLKPTSEKKGLFGGFFGGLFGKKDKKEKEDKPEVKTSSFSDSIKYSVKRGEVDPDSLEEGVPLEKAQQHYYQKNIKELNFKIRQAKRKGTDTSEMEKKLIEWQTKFNNTLEFGGIPVGYNVDASGKVTYGKGLQPTGEKGQKGEGGGFKRAVGGFADFATGGTFDFDKKNRKGAPKDFGIRRVAGGVADWATMGLTDFDKRGKGNLQFDPISGGKDKAWGSANEQAKRREKQSGMGIKRGIGGALDFATLGTFDFDKQNRRGAPKGWGIKRVAGGLADAITMGATDFDKRGAGIGQYSGFTGRKGKRNRNQKRIDEILSGPASHEAALELQKLGYNTSRINSWMTKKQMMSKWDKIPKTTTENPDGSITTKGSGRLIGGELFTPDQPLSEKQYALIKLGISAQGSGDHQYGPDVMKSYKMYEDQSGSFKPVTPDTSVTQQVTDPPESDTTEILEAINAAGSNTSSAQGGQVDNRPGPRSDVPATPVKGTFCTLDCINMSKSNSQFELQF